MQLYCAGFQFGNGFVGGVCVSALLWVLGGTPLLSQVDDTPPFFLDSIRYHRIHIADTTSPYDLFARLTNAPHVLTKESVLRKGTQVTLELRDTLDAYALNEYEVYLRDLGVFGRIDFDVFQTSINRTQPNAVPKANVNVTTEDGWSLYAEPYYDPEDDRTAWYLLEGNFLGYAKRVGIGGDLEGVGDSLWRGIFSYRDPALFGTAFRLDGNLLYSQPVSEVNLALERPFYSDRTPRAYGGSLHWADGDDRFFFRNPLPHDADDPFYLSDTNRSARYGFDAWVGFSNRQQDVFRSSLAVAYNQLDLQSGTPYPQAFDNSASFFAGISSLRRKYVRLKDYEFTGTKLVPIGAQGRISIGKISPVNSGLDNVIYVGADVRQSVLWGDFYGFIAGGGGTGIQKRESQYIMQFLTASGATPLGPGVLASRISQSTVWRWPRYVLLSIAEVEGGVRGYDYLDAFGDNRILANVEYRLFPLLGLGLWDLGVAGFYDIGGVWDQGQSFSKAQFHSGAGLGLRLGKSGGIDAGFVRVDFAWNFDEQKFGGISFGIEESFNVFGKLEYTPPGPYIPSRP